MWTSEADIIKYSCNTVFGSVVYKYWDGEQTCTGRIDEAFFSARIKFKGCWYRLKELSFEELLEAYKDFHDEYVSGTTMEGILPLIRFGIREMFNEVEIFEKNLEK